MTERKIQNDHERRNMEINIDSMIIHECVNDNLMFY